MVTTPADLRQGVPLVETETFLPLGKSDVSQMIFTDVAEAIEWINIVVTGIYIAIMFYCQALAAELRGDATLCGKA